MQSRVQKGIFKIIMRAYSTYEDPSLVVHELSIGKCLQIFFIKIKLIVPREAHNRDSQ